MRRDGKFPLLADTHIRESLVPALDHLTDTQLEGERLVAVIAETMRHIAITVTYRAVGLLTAVAIHAEARKRYITVIKR
jgi:hypothetical protein